MTAGASPQRLAAIARYRRRVAEGNLWIDQVWPLNPPASNSREIPPPADPAPIEPRRGAYARRQR